MRSPQQKMNDMAKLVQDLADCAQAHCTVKTVLNAAQTSLMENLIRVEMEKRTREEIEHVESQRPVRITRKTLPPRRSIQFQPA